MTFKELTDLSKAHQYAVSLDSLLSKTKRKFLRLSLFLGSIASFIFAFIVSPFKGTVVDSIFFVFVAFFLFFSLVEFFYNSSKNEYVKSKVTERFANSTIGVDYGVSLLLSQIDEIDASRVVFESPLGLLILQRLNVDAQDVDDFLKSNRAGLVASFLDFHNDFVTLEYFALVVYEADEYFKGFLSKKSIGRDELIGAVKWASDNLEENLRKDRFWSRENLESIPSISYFWGLE